MTKTIEVRNEVGVFCKTREKDELYNNYYEMLKDVTPTKAISLFDGSETIFTVLRDLGYIALHMENGEGKCFPRNTVMFEECEYTISYNEESWRKKMNEMNEIIL